MTALDDQSWRRALARTLSRQASASAQQIIASPPALGGEAYRIGITGPPGAGKSSLIAALAALRLARDRRVGVLAIDPTSPVSGGSLLGDRVRMDGIADQSGLFIRSVPSRSYMDGLCPNVLGLLDSFEQAAFDDVILETVGVGQINYAGRHLVDTFVLVMAPESGDTVQAMKGGILETADIYVVNKADLGAGERLVSELRSIAGWRSGAGGWTPPVLLVSAHNASGCAELDAAIDAHRAATAGTERSEHVLKARRAYQLRSLLRQRLDEVLSANAPQLEQQRLDQAHAHVLAQLKD
jgi:LAO/AO transport system kinase